MTSFKQWAFQMGFIDNPDPLKQISNASQNMDPESPWYFKKWYHRILTSDVPVGQKARLAMQAIPAAEKTHDKMPVDRPYTYLMSYMDRMYFTLEGYGNPGDTIPAAYLTKNYADPTPARQYIGKVPSAYNCFNAVYWEVQQFIENSHAGGETLFSKYEKNNAAIIVKWEILDQFLNTLFPDPISGQPFPVSSELVNFRVNAVRQNIGCTFRNKRWWSKRVDISFPLATVANWTSPYFNNAEWIVPFSTRPATTPPQDWWPVLPNGIDQRKYVKMYRNPFIAPRYDALRSELGAIGQDNLNNTNKSHYVWPLTQNSMDFGFTFYAAGGLFSQYNITSPTYDHGSGEEKATSENFICNNITIRSPRPQRYYDPLNESPDLDEIKDWVYGPVSIAYGGQAMSQIRKEWTWSEIWALSFLDELRYLSLILNDFFTLYMKFKQEKHKVDTTYKNLKLGIYTRSKALFFLSTDTSDNILNAYQELTSSRGNKFIRTCNQGIWSDWKRNDVDSIGMRSFEVIYGDLNVIQLGSKAALFASGNGNSEYNLDIPPQAANQKWTIYTRDIMLDGLPETARFGVDPLHSKDSGYGVHVQNEFQIKRNIASEIKSTTAEIMYDKRYNFYYNGGYIPPSQMVLMNTENPPDPYGDWMKETYTIEIHRPMTEQLLGIMECYYNGFEYIQEWEPISKNCFYFEPYINRSRYKYRRTGVDYVISLADNASPDAEDSYYSIEWSPWYRIDNCESIRSLGVVNWYDLYMNNLNLFPYRGNSLNHGPSIDVITNFYEIFRQPIDTIYYILLDNTKGYWHTRDRTLNEGMTAENWGEIVGLPDVSLEKGPGRYLMRMADPTGASWNFDPWGNHFYRIKFNFKYGILISNKNRVRPYLEFRDLGDILDKTKTIGFGKTIGNADQNVDIKKMNYNNNLIRISTTVPLSIITGKPIRFSFKEFGSDFYYYKEGKLFDNTTIWGPWHSIDSRLINYESRINLIEWFIGIPPGAELVGPPPAEGKAGQQMRNSTVYKSYRIERTFHHEISGALALRLGYDNKNMLVSRAERTQWYKGMALSMKSSIASTIEKMPDFLSDPRTELLKLIERLFPAMYGQMSPYFKEPESDLNNAKSQYFDFTIFGWIYELQHRTDVLYPLFPMIIMLRIVLETLIWIIDEIKKVVILILNAIQQIPKVRWYWIGISFTTFLADVEKPKWGVTEDKVDIPDPGGLDDPFEEVLDGRDENFPDLDKPAAGFNIIDDLKENPAPRVDIEVVDTTIRPPYIEDMN